MTKKKISYERMRLSETFYDEKTVRQITDAYVKGRKKAVQRGKVIKKSKKMIVDGDKYYSDYYELETENYKFPNVTGLTPFSFFPLLDDLFPKISECRYDVIMSDQLSNKAGEYPQIKVGEYGSGKSQQLNRDSMYRLAKGYKTFTFFDIWNEPRNIMMYGFYDEHEEFIPFKIRYLLPEGIEVSGQTIPLWEKRKNVELVHYSSIGELFDYINKDKYVVNAIYQDCYTRPDALKLFILLYREIREHSNFNNRFYFFHHELSQLFPQNITKANASLLNKAANYFVELRKAYVKFDGCVQLPQELYYRLGFKFVITQNFMQSVSAASDYAARDSLYYRIGQSNFAKGGLFMRHEFGEIPEVVHANFVTKRQQFSLDTILTDSDKSFIYDESDMIEEEVKKSFKTKFNQKNFYKFRRAFVKRLHEVFPELTQREIAEIIYSTPRMVGHMLENEEFMDLKKVLQFNFD